MGSRPDDWQEGPSLVDSIRTYRWLVVVVTLIGAVAAYAWSSIQPVRYEGVVRVYLSTEADQSDPGRVVRAQAQYINSPAVLDRAAALTDGRLTRKQLEERLTVEPATDTDLITIRVLDATPQQAASLADQVVRAYRETLAEQRTTGAQREVALLGRREQQLASEIAKLEAQLPTASAVTRPRLEASRDAKRQQLNQLATQVEEIRRSARTSAGTETMQERAAVPDEPAQPKPLRNTAIGAVVAALAAAALAWWRHGRWMADLRLLASTSNPTGGLRPRLTGSATMTSSGALLRDSRQISVNGSPAGNGSASGIADFDQVATSIQQLFRSLDGPPQKLYEENLPQMVVEQISQSFPVDLAVLLLKTDDGVRIMGSVGPGTVSADVLPRSAWDLVEAAATSGPRLVYLDELPALAGTGLEREHDVSLALVPLVRDRVGFGVLVTGRRQDGDEEASQLGDDEVGQIAAATYDMVPYLWAWLLLRSLKLRLGTLQ